MENCTQIQLLKIATNILNSNRDQSKKAVANLLKFYKEITNEINDTEGDIFLENGIALSQQHAADCLNDYKRTTLFIKGIYAAIKDAFVKFPETRINILYAGCGPYATLILPLLGLFKTSQIKVTLIDINKSSINTIKAIVKELNLSGYFSNITVANAITYSYPKTEVLHMVVSETMFYALTEEPQVAITQNLASQLTLGGFLIPEKIDIKLGYSFYNEEPFLNQHLDKYQIKNKGNEKPKRKLIDTLFSIDNNIKKDTTYNFKSNWYNVPTDYNKTPDICLYTFIKVYKEHQLSYEDSLITNPFCVGSFHNLKNHSQYQLKYTTKNLPKWELTYS